MCTRGNGFGRKADGLAKLDNRVAAGNRGQGNLMTGRYGFGDHAPVCQDIADGKVSNGYRNIIARIGNDEAWRHDLLHFNLCKARRQ